jgi:hypothetical protein
MASTRFHVRTTAQHVLMQARTDEEIAAIAPPVAINRAQYARAANCRQTRRNLHPEVISRCRGLHAGSPPQVP